MKFLQLNIGTHELSDVRIFVCNDERVADMWSTVVYVYEDTFLYAEVGRRFELNHFVNWVKEKYGYSLMELEPDSVATVED